MKIVFLDANTLGEDLVLDDIALHGEPVIYLSTKPDEVIPRIADAEVIFTNKIKLDEFNLKYATQLKLICEAATGYDNIDIEYCKNHGIAVCNVAGYSTDSVAQVTIATALYLWNHMKEYHDYVSSGTYTDSNCFNCLKPVYHELNGKTWGIIGLGTIGLKVASIAKAFGLNVIAYTRTPKTEYPCLDLQTVLKESDIISIHTPLNEKTRNLIGKNEVELMKDGAILINEARGAVLNEFEIAQAVKVKKIGFGCDVFSKEPFSKDHPYYEIKNQDNVCFTPHMAWGSYEARKRCLVEMLKNLESFKNAERRNRIV